MRGAEVEVIAEKLVEKSDDDEVDDDDDDDEELVLGGVQRAGAVNRSLTGAFDESNNEEMFGKTSVVFPWRSTTADADGRLDDDDDGNGDDRDGDGDGDSVNCIGGNCRRAFTHRLEPYRDAGSLG